MKAHRLVLPDRDHTPVRREHVQDAQRAHFRRTHTRGALDPHHIRHHGVEVRQGLFHGLIIHGLYRLCGVKVVYFIPFADRLHLLNLKQARGREKFSSHSPLQDLPQIARELVAVGVRPDLFSPFLPGVHPLLRYHVLHVTKS